MNLSVLLYVFCHMSVISCFGQSLPPMDPLPPTNTSVTLSEYDMVCRNASESVNMTDLDNASLIFMGAVALNSNNECEVICQQQYLQEFTLSWLGNIITRSLIVGSLYPASMPDNSTCAETGLCMNGTCSMMNNSTGMPTPMPTTNGTNSTVKTTPMPMTSVTNSTTS